MRCMGVCFIQGSLRYSYRAMLLEIPKDFCSGTSGSRGQDGEEGL
jgi:hypothetical protein